MEIYDVYHDECKFDAYWHCFLFVPRSKKAVLLSLLQRARDNLNMQGFLHFTEIGRKSRVTDGRVAIARAWLSIGIGAIQQSKLDSDPCYMFLGRLRKSPPVFVELENIIGAKLVILKERGSHTNCYPTKDPLKNIETTFRMGLKGALHRLFSDENPMVLGNIYIDGDEHYYGEYGRTLDVSNIINRIDSESRSYVNFEQNSSIIAQRSDHRKIGAGQLEEDSHLLQLSDLFLGAIRLNTVSTESKDIRLYISTSMKDLLKYDTGNYARMRNSRYSDGFLFSEAWIENGLWKFEPMQPYEIPVEPPNQLSLF